MYFSFTYIKTQSHEDLINFLYSHFYLQPYPTKNNALALIHRVLKLV